LKVLIVGGGGQVARAVAGSIPAGYAAVVKTRVDLDISDERAVTAALETTGARWLVNGAAYTAVDRAETDEAAARAINDTAVGVLARATTRAGARLLHISTDFVFDGHSNRAYLPTDATNPQSVYAATKLAGEQQALRHAADAVIVRTAWVYASTGRNFPLTMLRLMREKPEVRVVADQIGTPSWATGIARAIWGLIEANANGGIYHWTDLGVASWYDFAVAIQDEALARGLLQQAVPVVPISTADYPTPARRPAFSVLDGTATRAVIKAPGQHWRHQLRSMLNEL
jgi:dTDP-4-dehydrorhamnose reductase